MFATKGRLIAMVLVVGFLVASLGMFAPPAYSDFNCFMAIIRCCGAISQAHRDCEEFGSSSTICTAAQEYAGAKCAQAANICGYPVYHLCYN